VKCRALVICSFLIPQMSTDWATHCNALASFNCMHCPCYVSSRMLSANLTDGSICKCICACLMLLICTGECISEVSPDRLLFLSARVSCMTELSSLFRDLAPMSWRPETHLIDELLVTVELSDGCCNAMARLVRIQAPR